MKKNALNNNSGFTLIETIVVVGLVSLTLVVCISILTTSLNLWAQGSSGTNANTYAAIAMRKLILDVEEGQSAVMLDTYTDSEGLQYGRRLRVTFPYRATSTSDYTKGTAGQVTIYFLSDETGSASTGTYLWKQVGTTKTQMAKNMELQSLKFYVAYNKLVRINMVGYDQEGSAYSPNQIQQSVKLRNS